ncbi:conserved hypothetical protein [Ricinus communis]|uniref:Uncharacterized protein n=1 Tax=Ricinus communis TaxID=3988 RepID=B9SEY3_RICCO|nr:conserved hypothetical protein [Ricinus communis]
MVMSSTISLESYEHEDLNMSRCCRNGGKGIPEDLLFLLTSNSDEAKEFREKNLRNSEYYAYMLQIRETLCLQGNFCRIIEKYIKQESTRLVYYRRQQSRVRTEFRMP